MIVEVSPTANVVLDGSGNGQVFLGPPTGTKWALRLATMSTSAAVKHPKGFLYRGSASGPLQLVDNTITGDAASSGKVAGPVYFSGQGIWAVWKGGDPGATATLQLYGQQGGRLDPLAASPLGEGFPNQIALIAQSLQLGGDGTAGNPGITFGVTPIPTELVTYYAGLTDPGTLVPGTLTQLFDGTSSADYRYTAIFADNGTPPSQQLWYVEGLKTSVVGETARWAINFGGALGNPDIVFSPSIAFLIKALAQVQVLSTSAAGLSVEIAGEAGVRLTINGDGSIHWADGTNPADLSISRFVAGRLQLGADNALDLMVSVAGNAGNAVLRNGVVGEANARWFLEDGGKMHWGPGGATSQDTILYRAAASVLAADPIKANISGAAEVWNPVTLQNLFTNRGAGFPVLSYRKVASPANGVEIKGQIVSGATIASGTQIGAALPAAYRPLTEQTIQAQDINSGAVLQFAVETNGNVLLFGTWASTHVIQVNGVIALDL